MPSQRVGEQIIGSVPLCNSLRVRYGWRRTTDIVRQFERGPLAQAPEQMAVVFLADDEGASLRDEVGVDLAAIRTTVDDPDAAATRHLRHRRHSHLQFGVLAHEVWRGLRVERAVERNDSVVLVLDADHLRQPITVGNHVFAAVANPRQVFHLLGIGFGDVGRVQDQKRVN